MSEEQETTTVNHSNIIDAMHAVMEDIGYIEKSRENTFDNYSFRGIDDVLNSLQPALIKNGVVVIPTLVEAKTKKETTSGNKPAFRTEVIVKYQFTISTPGHETQNGMSFDSITVTVPGEGMDRGDKGVNKAMSSAFKNAIFQTFAVPVEGNSVDPETDSLAISKGKTKDETIITAIEAFIDSATDVEDLSAFWIDNKGELESLEKENYDRMVEIFSNKKKQLTKQSD